MSCYNEVQETILHNIVMEVLSTHGSTVLYFMVYFTTLPVSKTTQHKMAGWMMNQKGFERKYSQPYWRTIPANAWKTGKTTKNLNQDTWCSTGIQEPPEVYSFTTTTPTSFAGAIFYFIFLFIFSNTILISSI
jgi:hypothetical protein